MGKQSRTIRAMTILDAVARADKQMRASDLVATCDLPRATVHRICGLLGERGYLRQQIGANGYIIGPSLIEFANLVLANKTQNDFRHAVLESVAREIGETCNIAIPDGDRMVYWDRVETKWPLRHQLAIGAHVPMHCTANGKLYLSTLSADKRQRLLDSIELEKLTSNTITGREELESALAEISRTGVSTDNEEFIEGMIAIAVPITDAVGRFVAGLAIHAPTVRLKLEDALGFIDVLKDAASKLGSDVCEAGLDSASTNRS